MYRIFIFIILICFSSTASANDISESQKISHLLNSLENSKVIFIRNGGEHSGSEAKKHLKLKLEKAGTHIKTADDFITKLGSKSSTSGKLYYVKLPNGTIIESEIWLRKKLAEIEAEEK